VVASGPRTIDDLSVPQIADQLEGSGPLGGLAAGLAGARHELVHVLACDLPHADAALLRALGDRWRGEAALIPSAGGRPQPLHALWAADAATELAALLEQGVRSVMEAADRLGATVLTDDQTGALAGDPRWATNLNRPSDLQAGGA
jgi:molybdenum cofactor guanylyltransferase